MMPWPEDEMRKLLGAELNPRALGIKEMTDKLKIFKQIETEIDQIEKLTERIAELIYKAAYNEAIEDALKFSMGVTHDEILKLKKE